VLTVWNNGRDRAAGSHVTPNRSGAAGSARHRWLLAVAIVLTAVNLRTAVTSVGPLLDELESALGLGPALAGVLTTLPVLSFALLGASAPALARRIGDQRAIVGSLVLMTIGVAGRALADTAWLFLLMSLLALAAGAVGNVLIPALIKEHFPNRIGPMTAAYTTALAIGMAAAAGLAAPLAAVGDGGNWRLGLGAWALLSAVSVVPWLIAARGRPRTGQVTVVPVSLRAVAASRLAWAMALFFGAQSLQAYVAFGWFAQYFRDAGLDAVQAGLWVALLSALVIPASLIIPVLAGRLRDHRMLIIVLVATYAVAYTGMLVAPVAGRWLWLILVGTGSACFPLALTLIGMRSRTGPMTAALSAFTQSVGYLIAGAGPLLVGVLYGVTQGWAAPFGLLFAVLAVQAVTGWLIGRPRHIDDELSSRVRRRSPPTPQPRRAGW
jgi:MFS transporter, CP family, cyanate transporter